MINLDLLAKTYFWFDKPVKYKLKDKTEVFIKPVQVIDSEMFLSWLDILCIDKNAISDPNIISMSYLDFIVRVLLLSDNLPLAKLTLVQLTNILRLCLGWEGNIGIKCLDNKKIALTHEDSTITSKQFDEIRRIILYQNLIDFDDSYINPDVKQAMQEMDEVQSKVYDTPNLERRIAIISSHTGITKQQQLDMTYRSHCILFREVCGEVEFSTVRTAVMVGNMFSKKKNELEDWIYKRKHSKYEKYFTSQDTFANSMGGKSAIRTDNVNLGEVDLSSFID